VEFAKSKNLDDTLHVTSCQSPPDLNGTLLKDLTFEDMNCDEGKITNTLYPYEFKFMPQD
jgi:hypothetical protein